MNDERVWNPIIQACEVDRKVVAAQTHLADTVAVIAARAIERMPQGPFAVAGFSLGGYVALEVSHQALDRIAGIALLDTGARADPEESKQNRQRMINALGAGSASLDQVARAFAARILHPANATNSTLLTLLAEMASTVGIEGFVLQQTAAMHRNDRRDILGKLHCPALVLCGQEDQVTPPALSQEMAQLVPGDVELVLVPEAGHMSTLEQPELVAKAFARWIEKVDAAAV